MHEPDLLPVIKPTKQQILSCKADARKAVYVALRSCEANTKALQAVIEAHNQHIPE